MSIPTGSRTPSFIDDDRPDFLAHLREATTTPSPVSDILSDPSIVRVLTRPSTPRRSSSRHSTKSHRSYETETPQMPLLSLVLNEEGRQSSHLKMLLNSTADRLEYEMRKADAADRRAQYAEDKLRQASERIASMTIAQHQTELTATRAAEEAKRYKMMLDNAQTEIERVQTNTEDLEARMRRAESQASQARDVARQYERALSERDAKEKGRQEGLKHGGQRFVDGIVEGRKEGYEVAKKMERARRKKIYVAAFEAGRVEGFDEGNAQGRAYERRNAIDAFDRFLEDEGISDERSNSGSNTSRRETEHD